MPLRRSGAAGQDRDCRAVKIGVMATATEGEFGQEILLFRGRPRLFPSSLSLFFFANHLRLVKWGFGSALSLCFQGFDLRRLIRKGRIKCNNAPLQFIRKTSEDLVPHKGALQEKKTSGSLEGTKLVDLQLGVDFVVLIIQSFSLIIMEYI